jgi:hypothetical protein
MTRLVHSDFAYELNDALTVALASLQLDLDEDAMDELLNDATYAVCDLVEAATREPASASYTLMGDDCEQDMDHMQTRVLLELDWIELDDEMSNGNDLVYIPTMNGLIVDLDGDHDMMMQVAERDHRDVIAALKLNLI